MQRGPRGFTLIEILIAIAIIALLVSIIIAVYGHSLTASRIEATRTTITVVDGTVRDVHRTLRPTGGRRFAAMYNGANGPGAISDQVADLILAMDLQRAAFPSRELDLYGLNGVPDPPGAAYNDDAPVFRRMFQGGVLRPDSWLAQNVVDHAADSSELLLAALEQQNLDEVPARHLGDTDGDGNLELLDEWGRPLRWYNFTTRLVRPGGPATPIDGELFANTAARLLEQQTPGTTLVLAGTVLNPRDHTTYAHPINQNPLDYLGLLGDPPTGGYSPLISAPYGMEIAPGVVVTFPAFDEATFCMPDTYTSHLLISAGPDETLGLVEPDGWNGTSLVPALRTALPLDVDAIQDNVVRAAR